MEEKIDRVLALLEENNEILKEIKSKIEMSESEECVTKRTLHDFINKCCCRPLCGYAVAA